MPELSKRKKDKIFEEELLPNIDALHTFAYHLSFNDDDAKDLVQESFLKAYRALDSYEPGTNAKAWLFKILKNAYINEYRKKVRRPTKVDYEDYIGYQDREDQASIEFLDLREEIFDNLIGDEVTSAVNSLPVDFRAVILLCDVEGFTYEEISRIIDIPIGTVRSRLHRARNMLKEKLASYARRMGYEDKRGQRKIENALEREHRAGDEVSTEEE
ncbi:sigma-70 family RNA polymerase sigma factor [Membranicola marinus]|uniref:Sigma-70 family RNA polymerase sigma factor n=1 Tax=Membranihabitans marinus TaxID=1227546 RepID=A0A953HY30_9BACT|nr:sigma-70 family RNA polymerase sigma factor [Membranihabitans marinus]MBY5959898.1 sigma-70 family RNA polymerase sigma factor [Membranihabitans marinus]